LTKIRNAYKGAIETEKKKLVRTSLHNITIGEAIDTPKGKSLIIKKPGKDVYETITVKELSKMVDRAIK